jgi:hypothetical protein
MGGDVTTAGGRRRRRETRRGRRRPVVLQGFLHTGAERRPPRPANSSRSAVDGDSLRDRVGRGGGLAAAWLAGMRPRGRVRRCGRFAGSTGAMARDGSLRGATGRWARRPTGRLGAGSTRGGGVKVGRVGGGCAGPCARPRRPACPRSARGPRRSWSARRCGRPPSSFASRCSSPARAARRAVQVRRSGSASAALGAWEVVRVRLVGLGQLGAVLGEDLARAAPRAGGVGRSGRAARRGAAKRSRRSAVRAASASLWARSSSRCSRRSDRHRRAMLGVDASRGAGRPRARGRRAARRWTRCSGWAFAGVGGGGGRRVRFVGVGRWPRPAVVARRGGRAGARRRSGRAVAVASAAGASASRGGRRAERRGGGLVSSGRREPARAGGAGGVAVDAGAAAAGDAGANRPAPRSPKSGTTRPPTATNACGSSEPVRGQLGRLVEMGGARWRGAARASARSSVIRRGRGRLLALATMRPQALEGAQAPVQARDHDLVVETCLIGHVHPFQARRRTPRRPTAERSATMV